VIGVNTVTAELHFDGTGDPVYLVADGRGATSPDGRNITPLRWSTPVRDDAQVPAPHGSRRKPKTSGPRTGGWTYGEFKLTSLAYNVARRSRPVDQQVDLFAIDRPGGIGWGDSICRAPMT
jgi:hypothetical protein